MLLFPDEVSSQACGSFPACFVLYADLVSVMFVCVLDLKVIHMHELGSIQIHVCSACIFVFLMSITVLNVVPCLHMV